MIVRNRTADVMNKNRLLEETGFVSQRESVENREGKVMEFRVSVVTEKSVADAAAAVEQALADRNFSVLWQVDLNQKLADKGLSLEHEVRIMEVCNASKAKVAIETNPEVAYFLPCKVVVKRVGGRTEIGLAKPTMLMSVLGDERLAGLAEEVEAVLLEAVQAAR